MTSPSWPTCSVRTGTFLAPWEPLRADDYFTLQVVRPIQRDGALGPGDRRTAALRAPGALPTLAG
jgi:hypothetical protein